MSLELYCDEEVPEYGQNPCADDLLTGIADLFPLFSHNTFTDFSDAAQWAANEASGGVRIIRNILGSFPQGTVETVDNPRARGPQSKPSKMTLVLTAEDPNVSDTNDLFYAALNGKTTPLGWHNHETDQLYVWPYAKAIWSCVPATDESGNAVQKYMISVTWETKLNDFGQRVAAPAGVFED